MQDQAYNCSDAFVGESEAGRIACESLKTEPFLIAVSIKFHEHCCLSVIDIEKYTMHNLDTNISKISCGEFEKKNDGTKLKVMMAAIHNYRA